MAIVFSPGSDLSGYSAISSIVCWLDQRRPCPEEGKAAKIRGERLCRKSLHDLPANAVATRLDRMAQTAVLAAAMIRHRLTPCAQAIITPETGHGFTPWPFAFLSENQII
jgi:hypothetical protein